MNSKPEPGPNLIRDEHRNTDLSVDKAHVLDGHCHASTPVCDPYQRTAVDLLAHW